VNAFEKHWQLLLPDVTTMPDSLPQPFISVRLTLRILSYTPQEEEATHINHEVNGGKFLASHSAPFINIFGLVQLRLPGMSRVEC
jgi:hypothetical protein